MHHDILAHTDINKYEKIVRNACSEESFYRYQQHSPSHNHAFTGCTPPPIPCSSFPITFVYFPFLVPLCMRSYGVNFPLSLLTFSHPLGVFYYLSCLTCLTGKGNVTADAHNELGNPHAFLSHQLGSIGAGREVMAGCALPSVLTPCPGEVHLSVLQHYCQTEPPLLSLPPSPWLEGLCVKMYIHSLWCWDGNLRMCKRI